MLLKKGAEDDCNDYLMHQELKVKTDLPIHKPPALITALRITYLCYAATDFILATSSTSEQ